MRLSGSLPTAPAVSSWRLRGSLSADAAAASMNNSSSSPWFINGNSVREIEIHIFLCVCVCVCVRERERERERESIEQYKYVLIYNICIHI
jgi:hypothetical protein